MIILIGSIISFFIGFVGIIIEIIVTFIKPSSKPDINTYIRCSLYIFLMVIGALIG